MTVADPFGIEAPDQAPSSQHAGRAEPTECLRIAIQHDVQSLRKEKEKLVEDIAALKARKAQLIQDIEKFNIIIETQSDEIFALGSEAEDMGGINATHRMPKAYGEHPGKAWGSISTETAHMLSSSQYKPPKAQQLSRENHQARDCFAAKRAFATNEREGHTTLSGVAVSPLMPKAASRNAGVATTDQTAIREKQDPPTRKRVFDINGHRVTVREKETFLQKDIKRLKMSFAIFTRILTNHLETNDPRLYQALKHEIHRFAEHNKTIHGTPSYILGLKQKLKWTVGMNHWGAAKWHFAKAIEGNPNLVDEQLENENMQHH